MNRERREKRRKSEPRIAQDVAQKVWTPDCWWSSRGCGGPLPGNSLNGSAMHARPCDRCTRWWCACCRQPCWPRASLGVLPIATSPHCVWVPESCSQNWVFVGSWPPRRLEGHLAQTRSCHLWQPPDYSTGRSQTLLFLRCLCHNLSQ